MQFENITGQLAVKKHLVEMVQQNRLSHALLFLGKEGSGALSVALALAQYIVCEKAGSPRYTVHSPQPGLSLFGDEPAATSTALQQNHPGGQQPAPGNDSCGTCAACKKAGQLIHPDIHFAYPVVTKKTGSPPLSTDYIKEWREFVKDQPYGNVYDWLQFIKAENKQGNITANECNDIIRKLSLKSFESGYKILILWMPEYLGAEGNKLLKLIEEPPPDTLFILVAENESLILPTIVSRCQLIRIPALEAADIEAALLQQKNIGAGQARQVAAISDGNYREALFMLEQSEEDWQALLREWLNAILKTGPLAQTKWVEEVSRLGREKQKQFLRYFCHLLEQAIRLQALGADHVPMPAHEKDFALRLNRITGISQQQAIIEELDRAAYHIERNANAKILFHALTIRLYHIIQDKIVFLAN